MPYIFDFGKQYKIWFSPKKDEFLPMMNQLRLIEMREDNPNTTISLVYSTSCLNPKAVLDLNAFCTKYNIIPVDFDVVATTLQDPQDLELASLAHQEIEYFKQQKGGNLAAASDCARLIQGLIEKCGIYSDCDVQIKLEKIFPANSTKSFMVQLKGPVLLYAVSTSNQGDQSLLVINNDFLAFSLEETRPTLSCDSKLALKGIQSEVIKRYHSCATQASFGKVLHESLQELLNQVVCQDVSSVFEMRLHLQDLCDKETDVTKKAMIFEAFKQTVTSVSGPEVYCYLFSYLLPKGEEAKFPWTPTKNPIWQDYRQTVLHSSVGYYDEIYEHMRSDNDPYLLAHILKKTSKKLGGDLSWAHGEYNKLNRYEKAIHTISKNVFNFWRGNTSTAELFLGTKCIAKQELLSKPFHDKQYGLTLRRAVFGGEMAVVQYLLHGLRKNIFSFDVNESSSNKKTALDWATNSPHLTDQLRKRMIRVLKSCGAKTCEELDALKGIERHAQVISAGQNR